MSQHVFARLVGFRLTIIPRAPYRILRADESSPAIDVEYISSDEPRFARLIPEHGGYKSQLDQFTRSLFDVLDVEDGPDSPSWTIETSVFSCCWPPGYAICSNNFPRDPGPFDLVGQNHELIYVQSPDTMPKIEMLCAASQTVIGVERNPEFESILLAYVHEGISWRQYYEVVSFAGRRIAITMQAPTAYVTDALAATKQVARSLALPENSA